MQFARADKPQPADPDGIQVGEPAPAFTLLAYPTGDFSLADAAGKIVVLYFYPKDDTPGCTKEACAFRDLQTEFAKLDAVIWGVSSDSVASHKAFTAKYELNFPLLSDEDGLLRAEFGNPAGDQWPLEMRITYIIDEQGIVRHIIHGPTAGNWEVHITGAQAAVAKLRQAEAEAQPAVDRQ